MADQTKKIEIRVKANDAELKVLNRRFARMERAVKRVERPLVGMEKGIRRVGLASATSAKAMDLFRRAFILTFAYGSIRGIIQAADSIQLIGDRLRNIAGVSNPSEFFSALQSSADNSAQSIEDFSQTFTRLKFAVSEYGVTTQEALGLTQTLANAFRLTGSTAQETANAIRQFTQALFSNRLGGDEFRSVSENAPVLLRAISKELGIGTERLREYAAAGIITSEVMLNALRGAMDQINEKADKMRKTFQQLLIEGFNELKLALNEVNQSTQFLSNSGELLVNVFDGLAGVIRAVELPFRVLSDIIGVLNKGVEKSKVLFEDLKPYIEKFINMKPTGLKMFGIQQLLKTMMGVDSKQALPQETPRQIFDKTGEITGTPSQMTDLLVKLWTEDFKRRINQNLHPTTRKEEEFRDNINLDLLQQNYKKEAVVDFFENAVDKRVHNIFKDFVGVNPDFKIRKDQAFLQKIMQLSGFKMNLESDTDIFGIRGDIVKKEHKAFYDSRFESFPQHLKDKMIEQYGSKKQYIEKQTSGDLVTDIVERQQKMLGFRNMARAFERFRQGTIGPEKYLEAHHKFRFSENFNEQGHFDKFFNLKASQLKSKRSMTFDPYGKVGFGNEDNIISFLKRDFDLRKIEAQKKIRLGTGSYEDFTKLLKEESQYRFRSTQRAGYLGGDKDSINQADLNKMAELLRINKAEFDNLSISADQFIQNIAKIKTNMDILSASDWHEAITFSFLQLKQQSQNSFNTISQGISQVSTSFENLFVEAPKDWKNAWSNFIDSLLETMTRMVVKLLIIDQITRQISNSLLGSFGEPVKPRTGVPIDDPLRPRRPDEIFTGSPDHLSKVAPVINIQNYTNDEVEVSGSQAGDIDIMIKKKVASDLSSGAYDSVLRSNFGLKRKGF